MQDQASMVSWRVAAEVLPFPTMEEAKLGQWWSVWWSRRSLLFFMASQTEKGIELTKSKWAWDTRAFVKESEENSRDVLEFFSRRNRPLTDESETFRNNIKLIWLDSLDLGYTPSEFASAWDIRLLAGKLSECVPCEQPEVDAPDPQRNPMNLYIVPNRLCVSESLHKSGNVMLQHFALCSSQYGVDHWTL